MLKSFLKTTFSIAGAGLLAACAPTATTAPAPTPTAPATASVGTFEEFLDAVAQRESSGNPFAVNSLGYIGLYQFGEIAMIDIDWYDEAPRSSPNNWIGAWLTRAQNEGVNARDDFLASTPAQDVAIRRFYDKVWLYIGNLDLDDYLGQDVGGVEITKSGLLAGWHLLGGVGLRDYLQSNGADNPADAYGTTIDEYLDSFGGYETPYGL